MVRASGGGTVLRTGTDAEYGTFVLLQHPDGYQSMYGHLDRTTVQPGRPVNAGEVIGLSGNSGRSSAPHLHFEIRLNGQSLDPTTLVKEGS
jgi:murein DD-endopeptidase MepM/ murein hydrolase activator NlpD